MRSKRDQVQAHTFIMSRLTSGMLLADPDAPESPLGRTTRGVVVSIIIVVVVAAGSVVYGLIAPGGNDSWRNSTSLVVNRDTGARYLYVGGRLRPVRNYASARLIGGTDLKTTDVGSESLSGTPTGTPIGIPGAPDSVPPAGDLESGAWQVCSTVRVEETDGGSTTSTPVTALVAGAPVAAAGLGSGQGLVVRGPDKATYLVWQGSRLRLDAASGAASSLGYGAVTPRPVSAAFLDALVPGPVLAPPTVPGRGTPGPSLDGQASVVGQVFQVRVPGSDAHYYLLREDGLVPLTATQAALVLGDHATRQQAYGGAAPKAVALGAATLKEHQAPGAAGRSFAAAGLPASPPRVADVPRGSAACARVRPDQDGTEVTTVQVPLSSLGPVAQPADDEVASACLPVDAVVVRPGHGVLVRALASGGTTVGNTTYFVTDTGVKYRVTSAKALQSLGYTEGAVQALPAPLLQMLPSGPDLSPEAAAGGTPVTTPPNCGKQSAGRRDLVATAGAAGTGGNASIPTSG
ncbi:type VII secretion protein EccB [Streptomyces sulfonofaciens]|uniref:Type VII secretion protein EccB n=1 Tax=Streptomyces sulfonofaciens TaxID=68272 RepID=A0A919L0G7_9ACTN|nr:type VII secretion protein EccB [Streptomyces sulfonofaciens]GHH80305.1 type VII secretion protein EccB [Streptomyces sulfonofaciens]